MLEAVADKLHDFNLFQLFFSQSGYRDFSVINIVGVAGRYGQVCWSVCLFRPEVLLNFLKESHSRDLIPRRQSGKSSTLPLLKCGNLYFVKEVHMEGGKQLDHYKVVALCTDNFNIYRKSLNLYSSHT